MSFKHLVGLMSMVVGLAPGGVAVMAATNQPIPILGPLVGYNPVAGTVASPGPPSSAPSSGNEIPEDGLPGVSSSDPTSSLPVDENGVPFITPDENITPTGTFADALIDLMLQPGYSDAGITATKTANVDPEQVILNLLGYTYEVLYSLDGTVNITYEFKFTNAMSEAEMQSVVEAETKGFPLVYSMVKESQGSLPVIGTDDYLTLVGSQTLLPISSPPTYAEIAAGLKEFSFDTPAFTMSLGGLNTAIEGQITGQLKMTIPPSGNTSSGLVPPGEGGIGGGEDLLTNSPDNANSDTSSTEATSSEESNSAVDAWGAGISPSSSSSSEHASTSSESSGSTSPYTGRHYVK